MFCMKCGQQIPANGKFCPSCGTKVATGKSSGKQSGGALSLVQLRETAPFLGMKYREELLAYRDSLADRWDYNAYVGILLGVGGSKHGDAACQNFAIGQGDNGNNTKRVLLQRGLMQVFEKYKGKNISPFVTVSDVEDEIVRIVPEYVFIRQKLQKVVFSKF